MCRKLFLKQALALVILMFALFSSSCSTCSSNAVTPDDANSGQNLKSVNVGEEHVFYYKEDGTLHSISPEGSRVLYEDADVMIISCFIFRGGHDYGALRDFYDYHLFNKKIKQIKKLTRTTGNGLIFEKEGWILFEHQAENSDDYVIFILDIKTGEKLFPKSDNVYTESITHFGIEFDKSGKAKNILYRKPYRLIGESWTISASDFEGKYTFTLPKAPAIEVTPGVKGKRLRDAVDVSHRTVFEGGRTLTP